MPACSDCHGLSSGPRNDAYPLLAGQPAEYLELQLLLFATGRRGGSPFAHLMDHAGPRLDAAQRRDVAEYYAGLDSEASPCVTAAAAAAADVPSPAA